MCNPSSACQNLTVAAASRFARSSNTIETPFFSGSYDVRRNKLISSIASNFLDALVQGVQSGLNRA